ncbi:MAG: hypothetical protein ACI90V_014034, partial [Bacillariaceae sp.]|jgi:hypothetical protein
VLFLIAMDYGFSSVPHIQIQIGFGGIFSMGRTAPFSQKAY